MVEIIDGLENLYISIEEQEERRSISPYRTCLILVPKYPFDSLDANYLTTRHYYLGRYYLIAFTFSTFITQIDVYVYMFTYLCVWWLICYHVIVRHLL